MTNPITSATITPAYGRDYPTKAKALADFESGKDFTLQAVNGSPWFGGRYCSIRDFPVGAQITIRFHKLQKLTIVVVSADKPAKPL